MGTYFTVDAALDKVAPFGNAVSTTAGSAGQMPTDPEDDTKPLQKAFSATRRVMDNLIIVLAELGSICRSCLACRVYRLNSIATTKR